MEYKDENNKTIACTLPKYVEVLRARAVDAEEQAQLAKMLQLMCQLNYPAAHWPNKKLFDDLITNDIIKPIIFADEKATATTKPPSDRTALLADEQRLFPSPRSKTPPGDGNGKGNQCDPNCCCTIL